MQQVDDLTIADHGHGRHGVFGGEFKELDPHLDGQFATARGQPLDEFLRGAGRQFRHGGILEMGVGTGG